MGVITSEIERDSRHPPDRAAQARNLLLIVAFLPLIAVACSTGAVVLGIMAALIGGAGCLVPIGMAFFGLLTRGRAPAAATRAYVYVVDTGSLVYNVEMQGPLRGGHLARGQKVAFWGRFDSGLNSVAATRAHAFEDVGRTIDVKTQGWTPLDWRIVGLLLVGILLVYAGLFFF